MHFYQEYGIENVRKNNEIYFLIYPSRRSDVPIAKASTASEVIQIIKSFSDCYPANNSQFDPKPIKFGPEGYCGKYGKEEI